MIEFVRSQSRCDGFSVASGLVGTFLGALFAGPPGDRYGSRDALKAVGAMYIASALGSAFCWNLESFYVFRFIGGLAIGASSVLAPVYISEIAPADRRGRLTGLFLVHIYQLSTRRLPVPARGNQQHGGALAFGRCAWCFRPHSFALSSSRLPLAAAATAAPASPIGAAERPM